MPLRIVFFGTPAFAVPSLLALTTAARNVAAVVTQPDRPRGRGQKVSAAPVKEAALRLGIPVFQPERVTDAAFLEQLRSLQPDLGVVVAYGRILPGSLIDLPRLGMINVHASLLPRWRGAAPIQRAILAGDSETGICIMRLEAGLDTGPVFAQRRMPIDERTTAADLSDSLAALGATALLEVIARLETGAAHAQPQAITGVTYANKIEKSEALIDWHADAAQISRQVRAFNPWPVAETRLNGLQLRIWRAHRAVEESPVAAAPGTVLGMRSGALHVSCGRGELAVTTLQLAGRRQLSAAEFANSQPLTGQRLG